MGVKWTEEQQKVIDLRDRNILVSAAAGSGKTAVLVERIIQRLTDERDPVDVDKLLIVTFTEAAAAEMKERIGAAIEKKLSERPGDTHLEQQATLIHSAAITTIHSFCLSVIREHFHVIGIDPGFRIAEEGELKLLKQDVLEEMLEECYASEEKTFIEFVEKFGTGKNDRKIEGIILKLYEYSRSYPQPDRWLDSCVKAYDLEGTDPEESEGAQWACRRARQRAQDLTGILKRALKICEEPDGPYMYGDMIEADLEEIGRLASEETFSGMYAKIGSLKWKRLSSKKDETVSQEKKEQVQKLRKQVKDLVKKIQGTYFYAPCEEWSADMEDSRSSMETLAELVKRFSQMLSEKKQSRNMIDFNDMEQFALRILTEEKDGKLIPSPVAAEYQDRFEEVMIDEYQDSNLVQETILTSVSKVSRGQYDIFMVGDVKQSIYRFRLSRPELFMEKYDTYSLDDSEKQRIDLHKNFRSRPEVLDSVNYVFRKLMRKEFGGIEYDDNAALYPGAQFPPLPEEALRRGFSDRTELLLLDAEDTGEEDARRAEARMIAQRIRELISGGTVVDKESGEYRKIQYRDIVILTRSIRGWAEAFTSVLTEEGIPAYSVSREGYFETYEVSVLLDYLKILDNVRQDLPLTAALTSPFCGLDASELAQIRLAFLELPFYEAAMEYARSGPEEYEKYDRSGESSTPDEEKRREPACGKLPQLVEKLERFFDVLGKFREKVPYTPIHELLEEIIEKTGYGTYILAMPGGGQRAANVEMLVERAASFEGTSYKGLFNFVRYIEQLKKYDVDYGEAGILDEQSDTVRIMSIHKSKGLEFPVVFTAGMGKQFNTQDTKGSIVLHPEWGVGLDCIDLEKRTKSPTFLKKIIQEETALENLAEELRVLYVAMTRAKEKLILTGVCEIPEGLKPEVVKTEDMISEDFGSEKLKPEETEVRCEDEIGLYQLEGARTYLDWILPAVLPGTRPASAGNGTVSGTAGETDGEDLCPVEIRVVTGKDILQENAAEQRADILSLDVLRHWNPNGSYAPELRRKLDVQMDYGYSFEDEGKMKMKFTVSELKKRTALSEEAGEEMYAEPEVIPFIPEFLKDEEVLTGASRGSAYHKLLELLDFTRAYGKAELMTAVEEFREEGKLSGEMAECIRPTDILHFLHCESGERMAEAARRGKLYKEQPFVLGVDASEIYPGDRSGETILVQGIIDVFFEEEDGLVVLDYKTDKVRSAGELKEKYHAQLDYYAQALEQLLEKPVKEKIIYSFTLREEIKV